MKIQAALAHANAMPLHTEPIELDGPRIGEARVRILFSGVCHTDLTLLDHAPMPWPAVLGHEGAGVVEAIGPNVDWAKVGDPVLLTAGSCGECVNCAAGQPGFCARFVEVNMSGGHRPDQTCTHTWDGHPVFGRFFGQSAFATHAIVTERNTIVLEPDLPLELMAPLGCGVQTGAGAVLNTLKVRPATSLAVFGAGVVGLSAIMAAKIAGCTPLFAIDTRPDRLALARELGATETLDAGRVDPVAELQVRGGVDYAVEASGSSAVMAQTIAALAPNGEAVLVGVALGQTVSFDPSQLQARNLTIRGSMMAGRAAAPQTFVRRLIGFWREGRLPLEKLVVSYPFADINRAMDDMREGRALKPVLRMPTPEGIA